MKRHLVLLGVFLLRNVEKRSIMEMDFRYEWRKKKMIENVTKAVGPIAQEAVKKTSGKFLDEMFETFLRPKFEKMKNKPKNTEDILEILEEYYQKAYNKNKYMNTIVFKQETKSLDELYIPLTIVKNGKNSKEKIVINNNISNIFETRKRILIIDSAGMGKSTLTKFLYLKWLNTDFDIPFLIELRKVKNGMSLLDHICQELCLSEKRLSANDIKFLIERGDFIFFLDGYDEIPKENKEEVTKEIEKFLLEFNKNSFMLTSREEDSLNVFSEFEKYHIRPLEKKEAYELIRKYDNYGQVAENLICEIENNEQYEILEEFLENPLMVSLLYLTYHYKGIVQYKKPVFYRQVYDALYEGHYIVKGDGEIHKKKTGLDIDGFNDLLSAMGYLSIYKGKVSFDRNNLKQLIKEALDIYWHEEEIDVNKINIGCKVKLLDVEYDEEMEFYIVGSTEANSLQNKISNEAPVGRALIGKSVGDVVDVETQAGVLQYKVLEIQRNV